MIAPGEESRPTIVIVGNGMVGHELCSKLVHLGAASQYQVVVLGDEPRPAYDRVNLTQYFSGRSAADLELASQSWYEQNGIRLVLGERAAKIDRERRVVYSGSGTQWSYDYLVIATGSRPFVPPIEGTEQPGVFVYRTIEDLEKIRDYSVHVQSAAVLGGGLLGLEAAKALYDLKLETHVVEMAPGLMPRQLDAEGASVLQREIEQLGVHVHALKRTQRIAQDGSKRVLEFDNGVGLPVEMVVISAGIRPRDELATVSGLEVGARGGIVVDDRLCTSDSRIFAIGECALHRGTVYGLVAPGFRMANVLAANLTGGDATFEHGDQSARLKLMGVDVATFGEPLGEIPNSTSVSWRTDDAFRKLIIQNGRVVGAMSVGPWLEHDRVRQAIAAGRRMSSWQLRRFESTGCLWRPGSTKSVSSWPEAATVCSCLQVTRGSLSAAQRKGCNTVEQLADETGASTVCGSCKPLLCELVGAEPVPESRGWRGLLVASAFALGVFALWLAGPVAFAETVQSVWHQIDFIWRDPFWKQVTGFTLLGISAVSLLFSLRKRLKWLKLGEYGVWRIAHATIGALTLLGLAVHTGAHLGANMNFVLAATFLALNFIGVATAAITAWESRATGTAAMILRRWRGRVAQLHIWFFWPIPVLLVIHIVCVYYY